MEAGEGVSQPIYEERDVSTAPTSPTAAATSDGSNDGEEEATPAAQPTASATVAATRGAHNDDYRCSIKGCKLGKHPIQMDTCSANELDGKQKCDRQVHYECYRQLVIKKSNWENSPTDPDEDANLCFCTITCSRNYKKANAGGKHWNNDGKGGKDDQNCSENLLVRLFLSDQEKYNAYRDPFPNTKKDVCEKWAEVINSHGVRHPRTGKDVQNKINTIESQMRAAADFAVTSTGQGLQENEPESFERAILARCKFWNALRPVFIERASIKPLATTDDILGDSNSDDSSDDGSNKSFGGGEGFNLSDDDSSDQSQHRNIVDLSVPFRP